MKIIYDGREYVELSLNDVIKESHMCIEGEDDPVLLGRGSFWMGSQYCDFIGYWGRGRFVLIKPNGPARPRRIPLNPSFSEQSPLP